MYILGAIIESIIGILVGKWMAVIVHHLPKLILSDSEEQNTFNYLSAKFFEKNQSNLGNKALIIKILTGLLFAISGLLLPFDLLHLFILTFSCLLICCFFSDLENGILPDEFTLSMVWLGLIASVFHINVKPEEAILGAFIGYGFFWFINAIFRYFRGIEGMYPGDFKLNAGIGACIGINLLVPTLLISLILLIIVTATQALMDPKKQNQDFFRQEIPFGCYASFVALASIYFTSLGGDLTP